LRVAMRVRVRVAMRAKIRASYLWFMGYKSFICEYKRGR